MQDCWPLRQRDSSGNIVPDPQKFPTGMGGFSKSLKAKGVGLGIYTAHGNLTCQRFPGSLGHEKQDAALYKEWGVSFVKNDWCWHNEPDQSKHLAAFNALRDALNATGDPHCFWAAWPGFVDQIQMTSEMFNCAARRADGALHPLELWGHSGPRLRQGCRLPAAGDGEHVAHRRRHWAELGLRAAAAGHQHSQERRCWARQLERHGQ